MDKEDSLQIELTHHRIVSEIAKGADKFYLEIPLCKTTYSRHNIKVHQKAHRLRKVSFRITLRM